MTERLLLFFLLFIQLPVFATETEIIGFVYDSENKEALPYVSVIVKGTKYGTMTDASGNFSLKMESSAKLLFSMIGYKDKEVSIDVSSPKKRYQIAMKPDFVSLDEIIVDTRRKQRYRSKNNPAVDLIKEIIDKKDSTDYKKHDYCSFEHYHKLNYAWNDFDPNKNPRLLRRYPFLLNHVDTSVHGRQILPVGLRESIMKHYYQKSPEKEKDLLKAQRQTGLDEIFPQDGVEETLNQFFQEVNLYDDNVLLLSNLFVSPLSKIAPSFYKYYIVDTVLVDQDSCVNLAFTPRNAESFGFSGSLFVSTDTSRFIYMAKFQVPNDINLNFVESMSFEQQFKKAPDGTRLLVRDYMDVEFFVPALPRIYGERVNFYKDYSFKKTDDFKIMEEDAFKVEMGDAKEKENESWDTLRHYSLEKREEGVDTMMYQLKNDKLFRGVRNVLDVCVNNYIPTKKVGSQFDYGPFFSTISANRLEGFRMRLGGETTVPFDEHFFINTYLAFGFKDKLPKGLFSLEYSFNQKKQYHFEFPIHSLTAFVKYDVGKVGESFKGSDNILASLFGRTDDRNAIYQLEAGLTYQNEFYNGISYNFDYLYKKSYATWLTKFERYNSDGSVSEIDDYAMSTFRVSLRFAPQQKFYQSRRYRYRLNREKPVFLLSHSFGMKGLLGSEYNYNRTEFSYDQRFWLAYFGYVNLFFKATKVWNNVPYTLLDVPDASCSYTLKDRAFSLLDPVEFVCNQSITWDISYHLNGLILNRIPLLNKLRLREFVTFKGVWGTLSDDSNPAKGVKEGLFLFPSTSYELSKKPYMEVGVGLDNVLRLFRISYVWRLTYKDHVGVPPHGFRFALHLDF